MLDLIMLDFINRMFQCTTLLFKNKEDVCMHRPIAGGTGLRKQGRALISYRKDPTVVVPRATSASVSGCKLVLIRAAPPNYIQVRRVIWSLMGGDACSFGEWCRQTGRRWSVQLRYLPEAPLFWTRFGPCLLDCLQSNLYACIVCKTCFPLESLFSVWLHNVPCMLNGPG
jgi:hypothetical protein